MSSNRQVHSLTLHSMAHAMVAALAIAFVALVAVVPTWPQNAVPPTAREAAVSPAFAARLHSPAPRAARGIPAAAGPRGRRALPQDLIYANGPVDGICDIQECTVNAWTINFGYTVTNSIGAAGAVSQFEFAFWMFPGDKMSTLDWSIGTTPFASDIARGTSRQADGTLSDQFISTNQYGYDIHTVGVAGLNVNIGSGTWLTLANASVPSGEPVYWDENNGPSQARESAVGTILSESFNVSGGYGCSSDRPAPLQFIPRSSSARTFLTQDSSFRVLHDFGGGLEGGGLRIGPTVDQAGNVYGPSASGGSSGKGNIYKLSRHGSVWVFTLLYSFQGGDNDGSSPDAGLTTDPHGILYGTTNGGGTKDCDGRGCGTVYAARPGAHAKVNVLGGWTDTVVHSFSGNAGNWVYPGDLVLDQMGDLYGTTYLGGAYGKGEIFKLVPTAGGWQYVTLYSFTGGADGAEPIDIMLDQSGNLYGATYTGGYAGCGTIFELSSSGSLWTMKTLYTFSGGYDSGNPLSLVMDKTGNLYGVTIGAGCLAGRCPQGAGPGGVFMLSRASGDWTYSRLYNFNGYFNDTSLSIDASGNLYGTLARGGDPCYCGEIFKLAPGGSGWTYTVLHDFDGEDGFWPNGKVAIDSNGTVYGVTNSGGAYNAGVIWEISP